jgi:hypothetical protein
MTLTEIENQKLRQVIRVMLILWVITLINGYLFFNAIRRDYEQATAQVEDRRVQTWGLSENQIPPKP